MTKTTTKKGFVLPQPYEHLLGYVQDTYLRREWRSELKKLLKEVDSHKKYVSFYETCLEKGERYMGVDEFKDEEIEEEFIRYEEDYISCDSSVRFINLCVKNYKLFQNQSEGKLDGLEKRIFGHLQHQFNQVKVKFELFKKGHLVGGVI